MFFAFFFSLTAVAQTFSTTSATPTNLTGANGTCAAPGAGVPNIFDIPVAGIGILTATNALFEINITLAEHTSGSSRNLNLVSARVMSPAGTCVGVYSGGLSAAARNSHTITITSRTPCILNPYANGSNVDGVAALTAGNYGKFNAQFSGVDANLTTTFSGENANGTWKLIFSESTTSEPWVMNASLSFGDPTNTDRTADGNTCPLPIVWNGDPICASTNGKTASSQHPGYNGGVPSTFNNGTCDWNGGRDNDVWIQFTPSQANVCLSISGHTLALGSIIVTDPNTDGDNDPCTGANGGQYWNFVSCPRDAIYGSAAGTIKNQNHCFTATVGQTYYLVVDNSTLNANVPFYLSAIVNSNNPLPITLLSFNAFPENKIVRTEWSTASEINNDYFAIERSPNGTSFEQIGTVQGAGNSSIILNYVFYDEHPYTGLSYYRLRQVDNDGNFAYSQIRAVYIGVFEIISIFPNPADEYIQYLVASENGGTITLQLFDVLGREIVNSEETIEIGITARKLNTAELSSGSYLLQISTGKQEKTQKQFVIK